MIQDRLNDKDKEIKGVQKQSAELLSIAWQKGYIAGFDDGYATRRETENNAYNDRLKDVVDQEDTCVNIRDKKVPCTFPDCKYEKCFVYQLKALESQRKRKE